MGLDELIANYREDFVNYAKHIISTFDGDISVNNVCQVYVGDQSMWREIYSYFRQDISQRYIRELPKKISSVMAEIIPEVYNTVPHRAISKTVFYNVGQGLMAGLFLVEKVHIERVEFFFYTGFAQIFFKPEVSVYLYDCGSTRAAVFPKDKKDRITDFVTDCRRYGGLNENETPVIKYLFISHFDADHVNGIGEVCSNCRIENIVMAYQHPLSAVMEICDDLITLGSDRLGVISCSMRLNQQLVLQKMLEAQNGEINIIQLDNANIPKAQDIRLERLPEERLHSVGQLGENLLIDPENSYVVDAPNGRLHFYRAYPKTNNSPILGEYPNFILSDSDVWKLMVVYYVPAGKDYDSICAAFLHKLAAMFPNLPSDPDSPKWAQAMVEHLKNKADRRMIAQAYRSINMGSNLNLLSLCLAVAPVCPVKLTFRMPIITKYTSESDYLFDGALLLTGDAELQADCSAGTSYCENILDLMDQKGYLPLSVALIPHHGSEKNTDEQSFSLITEKGKCRFFVVSYGKNNSYGHPHIAVCERIGSHLHTLHRVRPKKRAFPEKYDGKCANELLIDENAPPQKFPPLINEYVMFHCNDQCKVVLSFAHNI